MLRVIGVDVDDCDNLNGSLQPERIVVVRSSPRCLADRGMHSGD